MREQPRNMGDRWKRWVAGVFIAFVSIAGTAFFEETGKQALVWIGDLWSRWTGSRSVQIVVFADPGHRPVNGAIVEIIPLEEHTAPVSRNADGFGRATFKEISHRAFYVQATTVGQTNKLVCTKLVIVKDYPYSDEIVMNDGCSRYQFQIMPQVKTANAGDYPWLAIAEAEIGTAEFLGLESNPQIDKYFASTGFSENLKNETVPWGCVFVGWVLTQSNIEPPANFPLCSSFDNFGTSSPGPEVGALGLLDRKGIEEARTGLVGFVSAFDQNEVTMIVGNVNNSVTKVTYPLNRVKKFIWPTREHLPRS
ncbi:hypothetical protein [Roseibium sp.]|uniref:hypothetical protein n=1 Tax=Roseibium sp. TaxID=1936156 RepID=UPI003A97BFD4